MRKLFFSAILVMASVLSISAANVEVTMNTVSTTMTLKDKATEAPVAVGEPTNKVYQFTAEAGTYILTGIATDGTTVNGTIELTIEGDTAFAIQTVTVYATNKVDDVVFAYGTDYTVNANLIDPNGVASVITYGSSTTAGRATFLAVKGSTTNVEIIPTAARTAERYVTYYDTTKNRTINGNANIGTALKQWYEWTLTVPAAAQAQVAQKTADYVAFSEVAFEGIETVGETKVYTYHLVDGQSFFYRVWADGLYTQAGYFPMSSAMPAVAITAEDMSAKSPKFIDHTVTDNTNLNVADVFVNINPQGHLKMQVGDTKDLLAQRTWQLTNSSVANMYVDPDYHYTVVNLNGEEDNSVVKLERYNTTTDPWTTLTAVGKGTAIVLVTYDAISLYQYDNKGAKNIFMGGSDWSAIWPENTGVFVVTVGDEASGITSNMFANKGLNDVEHKLAVDALDAEHDVIYYLGANGSYTFKPEGAEKVEIAYPTIGINSATYSTFAEVNKAEDGSYTLVLKEGRQIVRLTNAAGVADYQVITAKPCTRDITNISRPGEKLRAGDKVGIQYHGLFHPNNKLSRIYNMSAYVTYNGAPAGTSQYGGSGQYTFAAVENAQLYMHSIPFDAAAGEYTLDEGCIQINGYGDPVGNHRNIDRQVGRVFAGNAPSHKTYLGILPDINLEIEGLKHHIVAFNGLPENAKVYVMDEAYDTLEVNAEGNYDIVFGSFTYSIEADGYAPLHSAFTVSTSMADVINLNPVLTAASAAWDGETKTEPAAIDGVYQISNAAELAWLAQEAATATEAINAVLTQDINLGGKLWTPIATSNNPWLGTFDGQNHKVSGLYIEATTNYQGLFAKLKNGTIKNLTVEGYIKTSNTHAAGIVGGVEAGIVENCHFLGSVITEKANTAGIAGYVYGANAVIDGCSTKGYIYGLTATGGIAGTVNIATDIVRNCYNQAFVSGTGTVGGIVGTCNANTVITDVYNAGNLQMRSATNAWGQTTTATTIGAICGLTAYGKLENGYAAIAYNNESNANNKTQVLGIDACADGTLSRTINWGQKLGTDPYPVYGSENKLYEVTYTEQGKDAVTYLTEAVELGEVWIDNVLGWYHNAEMQQVTEIHSDTALFASVAIKSLTGAATFEERTLRSESAWYGDPDFVEEENYWQSGDFMFTTYVDDWGSSGKYFYDVTVSDITDKSFSWSNSYYDQHAAAGKAAEGKNYAVWYHNWYGNARVMLTGDAHVVSGMAVTNSSWVVDAIKNGDGMTPGAFTSGDFLKLTITGYNDDEVTGRIDYYLADFRDMNETYDWWYAENWQWVDLTELGKVDELEFSLMSSRANSFGMTTPAYFCFDNLDGKKEDCALGEMTHITGTKHYHVTYIEQGKEAVEYDTVYTELGEIWFDNVLGWYHNEAGEEVKVIDKDMTLYASVRVKQLAGAATFEERTLKPETTWEQDPDFVLDQLNSWKSGDFTFKTNVQDWSAWGLGVGYSAFTVSNKKVQGGAYDYYSNNAGGAAEGENYAVWNKSFDDGDIIIVNDEPKTVSGVAVTNNSAVLSAILNGDGMSEEEAGIGLPFHEGDYLKLVFKGEKDGVQTGTKEFYLADFRDDNTDYIWTYAEQWQWVHLTGLGEVDKITVDIVSSKANGWGMTTPAYVCIDNLGGERPATIGQMTKITGHKEPTALDELSLTEVAEISIYTVSGQLIRTVVDAPQNIINTLPQGVYLLRSGSATMKVCR